ncbi:MAG: helix-turn-helix transcriptional regulator [Actinobacteria bacterium]|nr:helix-turn-helix transcriptional regulator [Actinomycetota bacterium]
MTLTSKTSTHDAVTVASDSEWSLLLHLRSLRGGRSLEDVAQRAGIRADELSRIERGLTRQVRWETLLRLMRTYDCGPGDLMAIAVPVVIKYRTSPRNVMLAAMQSGVGNEVPQRRVLPREASTGLDAAAEQDLAEPTERGPIHRPFRPPNRSLTFQPGGV